MIYKVWEVNTTPRLRGGPGWIYSKKMEPQIRAYIKKGKHLDVVDNSNTDQNIIKRIDALEKKIDLLTTLLNRVLTEEDDEEEIVVDDESEVEEEEIPRKRLLKRN